MERRCAASRVARDRWECRRIVLWVFTPIEWQEGPKYLPKCRGNANVRNILFIKSEFLVYYEKSFRMVTALFQAYRIAIVAGSILFLPAIVLSAQVNHTMTGVEKAPISRRTPSGGKDSTHAAKPVRKLEAKENVRRGNSVDAKPTPSTSIRKLPASAGNQHVIAKPPKNVSLVKPPRTVNKPQEGAVTKLAIGAKPMSYNGKCPAEISFHCAITVSHPPVAIEYQWERSDGATSARQRAEIRGTSLTVYDSWTLGEGKEHLRVWEKLHIFSPKDRSSAPVAVNINCH